MMNKENLRDKIRQRVKQIVAAGNVQLKSIDRLSERDLVVLAEALEKIPERAYELQ